jgi:peptide deformylase
MNLFNKKQSKRKKDELELVIYPNEILQQTAEEIKNPLDAEIQNLIPQMFALMQKEKGIGLAAPQISKLIRLVVIDFAGEKLTLINPQIISQSKEQIVFPDACLSLPGKELPILRSEKVVINYTDEKGQQNKIKARETLAVIFQHEIDHLNGIVIEDRFQEQKPLREKYNIPDKI